MCALLSVLPIPPWSEPVDENTPHHRGCRRRRASSWLFERYLTIWVALCIVAGILFGRVFPGVFQSIAGLDVARVNIPVGILIWVMIIPMLIKIDFGALAQVRSQWRADAFGCWHREPLSQHWYEAKV